MESQRPVLLVDIDGVLNVFGVENCPAGYSEFELFPEDDEPARLCAIHGEWLGELGEQFDLTWASAWGFDAHRLLGPILGMSEFPCGKASLGPHCCPARSDGKNAGPVGARARPRSA